MEEYVRQYIKCSKFCQFCTVTTLLFTYFKEVSGASYRYGVLTAELSSGSEDFCIIYFEDFSSLPSVKRKKDFRSLLDQSDSEFCDTPPPEPHPSFEEKVVLVENSNCSVVSRAEVVHQLNGAGLLVTTSVDFVNDVKVNSSLAHEINITVALISHGSARRLKNFSDDIKVLLYAPDSFNIDFSLFLIWAVAVFTVAVGSFWSGLVRQSLHLKEVTKLPGPEREHHGKPERATEPRRVP
ncbi:signal peptide peptidase-like 2B [Tachypleus tridentatus]|uniref:signal peptide peptidase-like 2B n=1 Tax=Tachypleus tridentatus TaxID=6853 RepID=UPI003FD64B33